MPLGAFRLNSLGRFTAPAGRTAKTIVAQGTGAVSTAQSQFGGASALVGSAGTPNNGIYVATNGDYFGTTSPTYDMANWNSYAGGFTVELWVRYTGLTEIDDSGLSTIGIMERNDFPAQWSFGSTRNGALSFEYYNGSTTPVLKSANSQIAINTWYHIAWVRNGTNLKIYLNGVEKGSATISGTPQVVARDLSIGSHYRVGSRSYVDEIRISKTARYTAGFTPSTSPFTNDADTLFLCHANGTNSSTTFTDDVGTNAQPRTPRTITVGGNAKVSTAQSKFGGASALFDGTSDYLSVPGFSDLAFGTGNFTLEAWVRQSARSDAMTIFDTRNSGNTSGGFVLYMRADNVMELYWNSAYASSANPLPTVNTWYHVAVSRSGTALKVFVDGTAVISVTDSQNHSAAGPFIIGQDFQLTGTPGNSWNGYIDEVRFSNIARYTANFTPSASAFVNDTNTLLLIHANGTNASTTFTDDNA
jgi:hypothetical protein